MNVQRCVKTPPTQPAGHGTGMNPNYRGNPKNYIHNYRPNFKSGRGNGNEGGVSNGQGSSTGHQGGWGRGRQGEENSGQIKAKEIEEVLEGDLIKRSKLPYRY